MIFSGGEPVYFRKVGGTFTAFDQLKIENTPITDNSVDSLLKYKMPWVRAPAGTGFKPTEDESSGSYLPCVPHLDLTVTQILD